MRPISFNRARNTYIHRYTLDHIPAWAREPHKPGIWYAPQYASDREWYEHTLFPGEGGIERDSKFCSSTRQTWPCGNWLNSEPPAYPGVAMWESYSRGVSGHKSEEVI